MATWLKDPYVPGPSQPVRSLRFWPYHFLLGWFLAGPTFSQGKASNKQQC